MWRDFFIIIKPFQKTNVKETNKQVLSSEFRVTSSFNVKNMVSKSCIRLVNLYFNNLPDITVRKIALGTIEFSYEPKKYNAQSIEKLLTSLGFSSAINDSDKLVEQIKIAAIELIHYAYNSNSLIRNSDYIEQKVQMPYAKVARVFADGTGTTLEKYIIALKIEKVKELLINNEHTLSEIAYMLGYSSVHYLSNQFKKITGETVSNFKKSDNPKRIPLEELI